MHQFCDSQGRPWKVELTLGSMKRVKGIAGVNLLEPMPLTKDALEEGEQPLMTQLEMDPILLIDVIYALCSPQAEKAKVSDAEFGEAITPEVFPLASDAFWLEYEHFFLQLGRKPVATMIRKQRELAKKAFGSDEMADQIDKHLEAEIRKAEEKANQMIESEIRRMQSGSQSTN